MRLGESQHLLLTGPVGSLSFDSRFYEVVICAAGEIAANSGSRIYYESLLRTVNLLLECSDRQ